MNVRARRLCWAFIIHHSSFIIWLVPASLSAQVVRLPAVEPPSQSPPGQLVSHPDSPAEILQAPGTTDVAPASPPPDEPQLPPGVRNGVFQKVLLDPVGLPRAVATAWKSATFTWRGFSRCHVQRATRRW